MRLPFALPVASFAWLLALAACGPKVVVDQGTTGAGGDGAGGSASTGTGHSQLGCSDVCTAVAAVCPGSTVMDCESSCAETDKIGAVCPAAYQALLSCIVADAAGECGTDPSSVCMAEENAFAACIGAACSTDISKCAP